MSTAGLLLAAGAGRRRGGPKALAHDPDGTSWLQRSLDALADGGCDPLLVVLGAGADEARGLVPASVDVAVAPDWSEGMAASLRTGLTALLAADHPPDAVVVSLVDLPDVGGAVVARLLGAGPAGPSALARASYDGGPGHPVLLGRDHWPGLVEVVAGDRGARDYLATRDVTLVDCADLATGADQDT